MSFNATTTEQITIDGEVVSSNNSFTDSAVLKITETVADGLTDEQISGAAIDVSEIAVLYILSDQDVTLETNNAGAPADTIALLAGVPLLWYSTSYYTNLLTTDVTAIFITNASGFAAKIKIRVLYDSTP